MEDVARLASGEVRERHSFARTFSNFHFFAEQHPIWLNLSSLRRIFSEARRAEAAHFAVENLAESSETADETRELMRRYPDYKSTTLNRLTFWSSDWQSQQDEPPPPDSLLGYIIVRTDCFRNEDRPRIHVFESVFRKFEHFHNFVPCNKCFRVRFDGSIYKLPGVMYCQQNARTKACAQVALRSLLATRLNERALFFSEINQSAGQDRPEKGLDTPQIRRVLEHYGVNYRDLDYTTEEADRGLTPYGRLLYAGLENGCGGLLGFTLSGPDADSKHIIPFFGHTFNQDTWAPRAQNAYFRVGDELAYIPSDEWISSFIGHDDNFGSNFCVPKRFVSPDRVDYVVALLPDGCDADPVQAEIAASSVLYTSSGT